MLGNSREPKANLDECLLAGDQNKPNTSVYQLPSHDYLSASQLIR